MRISDWSSDVCSSDLLVGQQAHLRQVVGVRAQAQRALVRQRGDDGRPQARGHHEAAQAVEELRDARVGDRLGLAGGEVVEVFEARRAVVDLALLHRVGLDHLLVSAIRSEEHTSELQSLMRISYAVFCLKKKKTST